MGRKKKFGSYIEIEGKCVKNEGVLGALSPDEILVLSVCARVDLVKWEKMRLPRFMTRSFVSKPSSNISKDIALFIPGNSTVVVFRDGGGSPTPSEYWISKVTGPNHCSTFNIGGRGQVGRRCVNR
ncbi:unnamed protein product [Allacma fusca]|uniref:Uncharacterized protein n=1 Tax=Allacma fusca TaxID=39272 RepID=A0A8J2K894_9HEXA|nr:unnamed protein product [Allacma fusca]